MKQNIYYGNISASGLIPTESYMTYDITDFTIAFTGFDLSASNASNRLDLLFYNRVNEIGEVLSSLVYISNPSATLDNTTTKTYDVSRLYANTSAEMSMQITHLLTDFTFLNCKWKTSKYFVSSISPMVDTEHEELATNGNPSIKIEKYGISFDGWYTQMSVGLGDSSSLVGTPYKNLIAMHTFSALGSLPAILLVDDPADISLDVNWQYLYDSPILANGTTNPDGSILVAGISMANILNTSHVDNPYVKQDIFILPTYLELYDKAVVQYAEYPTYGNPFPILRDKHRMIHSYAKENDFLEAQYILQSTEYFRSVINK